MTIVTSQSDVDHGDHLMIKSKKVNVSTPALAEPLLKTVPEYRVYPERWIILVSVVLLNIANYAHWIAFPAVAKTVAKYYDQNGEKMDVIPTLSYSLGVPCSLITTYVIERYGLKYGIQIGGLLTGIGGFLCFLSSVPPLADNITSEAKYNFALIGQALTGIACPFVASVPTKVSQHWFAEEQRSIATALMGMSGAMGSIIGQGITPLFVREPQDVFWMNTVWFIPAAIGSILVMWKVHSNYPPLPPSPSAALIPKSKTLREWCSSCISLFCNPAFIIIFLFLGAAMGCVSSITTKMEQLLCSRGYSDQISGLAGSLILICASVTSVPIGLLAYKTGRSNLVCKTLIGIGLIGAITNGYFIRFPDCSAAIIFSCVHMGSFAIGSYALALELVVECTYPIDQATSTAYIFLSSALQGAALMILENFMNGPLTEEELNIQACVSEGDSGHQQPRDYSSYLTFITCYIWFFYLLFLAFFRTKMKRTLADKTPVQLDLATTNGGRANGKDPEASMAFLQSTQIKKQEDA